MFLYKIEFAELDDKIEIIKYFADKNFDTKIEKDFLNYEILLSLKDFEILIKSLEIKENLDFKIIDYNLKHYVISNIIKVHIFKKDVFQKIKEFSKEKKVVFYEFDLNPTFRYLINNDIKIEGIDTIPKILFFDIETITKESENLFDEIISISIFSPKGLKKVLLNTNFLDKNNIHKLKENNFEFELLCFSDEKALLENFSKIIKEFSPQMILGWNLIDFDFKIVIEKMRKHNLNLDFSKFGNKVNLKINKDFFKSSTLDISGILVFDIIELLKINFITFDDYKLDTVSKKVLKDSKIDLNDDDNDDDTLKSKIEKINNLYFNNTKKLLEYNFKDSVLCFEILEKLNIIKLIFLRSSITTTPLNKIKSPIASLDIMYLTKLHKQNIVAKTNFNFNSNPIGGAFVIDPKMGYYNNIFVFDFKSLYPNIIRTFNIDPFSLDNNGEIKTINGINFSRKTGILPNLISELSKQREIAKIEKNNIKQNAIKVTMNSFYGAIASPKSRFHNFDMGEAITSFGRDLIQKTKEFCEKELSHKVIYGDTDSVFISPKNSKHIEKLDAEKIKIIGLDIEEEINLFIKKYVKNFGTERNFLKIEFEKIYSKFFISTKKRYIGFDILKNDYDYVGVEFVRGDWTKLAKIFQETLIKIIFENFEDENLNDKIKDFIVKFTTKLEKKEFDNYLIYFKKLTKSLNEYTKTTPPHVKAAREVENFNERLVKYVMSEDGPKHISKLTENFKYDYKHYIEKQLYGVCDDILKPLNIDFLDIVYKKKQKGLNEFF